MNPPVTRGKHLLFAIPKDHSSERRPPKRALLSFNFPRPQGRHFDLGQMAAASLLQNQRRTSQTTSESTAETMRQVVSGR